MDTLNFLRTFSFFNDLDSISGTVPHLSGYSLKFLSFRRHSNTTVGTLKKLHANLIFQLFNRRGKTWLCDKQAAAASFMDLVSATAMAYFICIKVICEKLLYHSGFNIHTAPLVFLLDKL